VKSVSGAFYTDSDLKVKNWKRKEGYGFRRPIVGSIIGGGVKAQLSTVSGDIYLRRR
jgi:hypothetical protein